MTSANTRIRLPEAVEAALRDTGLPWRAEHGGHHIKIWVGGRLVGVCPGNGKSNSWTAERNIIAQIRRSARQAGDRVRA